MLLSFEIIIDEEHVMNLNRFKQLMKKNKQIDSVSRIIAYPMFLGQYKKSDMEAEKRHKGYDDPRYHWIKQLHNKFEGERCFVIATGPSLTMEDLNLIKSEYSFGMNSCVLAFDKTEWRPNFYAIQDEYVYEKLEECLVNADENDLKEVWVSENVASKFKLPERFEIFPLHYLDHKMFHLSGYGKYKFSEDCYSCIYDAYTITFSIMQFVCYMGFKEIYLLGCDCNYNQKKGHFIEYGHKDPKASIMGDKMIQGHYEFKKFADSIGVQVFNCTRGGMLEAYPRKELEEVVRR